MSIEEKKFAVKVANIDRMRDEELEPYQSLFQSSATRADLMRIALHNGEEIPFYCEAEQAMLEAAKSLQDEKGTESYGRRLENKTLDLMKQDA